MAKRESGNLTLFASWQVDAKVVAKLRNTCFEALIGLQDFKQSSEFLHTICTAYEDSVFTFDRISLYFGLEDIYFLLGLPVDGKPLVSEDFPAVNLCIDLLGRDQPNRGRKDVLENSWLKREFENVPANIGEHDVEIDPYVRAYILFIIGTLLFPEFEKVTVPILYLQFFRHVTAHSLNGYAWGAAVLAKLHSCLGNNNLKNSKGAMWVLERVVRVRRDFLVDMAPVPAQFPSFKGWASLLHRTTSNAHHHFVLPDIPPHQQVVPPPPPPEVVPFEEPHGDSPDTMQPQEQVPGGYSPVQPQEPSGYSPETSLGTSLHRNSSDSSQPPPYASPSHQVNASCF
ncbi:hypothetical protein LguiA_021328 [Lonicera macranthoides]